MGVGGLTQYIVSWSELDAGRQCPHKRELAYAKRWVSPQVSRPLDMGSLGHAVLEAHFKALQAGAALPDARAAAIRVLDASDSAYKDTVGWIYGRFCERYGADRQWRILGVEHEMRVPLDDTFILKVKLDAIVEDLVRKAKLIVDWKFSSRLLTDKELAFDDQFGLYEAAMNRAGHEVLGSLYGLNRTPQRGEIPVRDPDPPLDDWFSRVPLYRTTDEQDEIIEDALSDFHWLYSFGPDEAPRRPDPDRCKWRCSYTFPCLHGRKYGPDRERELLEAHGFEMQQERH